MSTEKTFATREQLYAIQAPTDKPQVEVWHVDRKSGFGARIMRKNTRTGEVKRTYIVRYGKRVEENGKTVTKNTKQGIGEFFELDYSDALRKALEIKSGAEAERRGGKRPLPQLGAALERYIEAAGDTLSPVSVEDYRAKWKKLTPWYDLPLAELETEWWTDRYLQISKEAGRTTASAVIRIAHAIYNALRRDGHIAVNPVSKVAAKHQLYKLGEPRQILIKRWDLPVVWRYVEGRMHPSSRDFFKILLFTGMRYSVVGQLKWEQVDWRSKTLLVPAETRGNKAKTLVQLPLCDYLIESVFKPRYATRLPNSPWVLPSPKLAEKPHKDIRKAFEGLLIETRVAVGPHPLRRTFATVAKAATNDSLLVARMLTHQTKRRRDDQAPEVTAGYIVTSYEDLRAGFEKTAALLLEYLTADIENPENYTRLSDTEAAPMLKRRVRKPKTAPMT